MHMHAEPTNITALLLLSFARTVAPGVAEMIIPVDMIIHEVDAVCITFASYVPRRGEGKKT